MTRTKLRGRHPNTGIPPTPFNTLNTRTFISVFYTLSVVQHFFNSFNACAFSSPFLASSVECVEARLKQNIQRLSYSFLNIYIKEIEVLKLLKGVNLVDNKCHHEKWKKRTESEQNSKNREKGKNSHPQLSPQSLRTSQKREHKL